MHSQHATALRAPEQLENHYLMWFHVLPLFQWIAYETTAPDQHMRQLPQAPLFAGAWQAWPCTGAPGVCTLELVMFAWPRRLAGIVTG